MPVTLMRYSAFCTAGELRHENQYKTLPESAAAISVESDALATLSIELKDEISRFTHNRQPDPVSVTATNVNHPEISGLIWLKPSANFAA